MLVSVVRPVTFVGGLGVHTGRRVSRVETGRPGPRRGTVPGNGLWTSTRGTRPGAGGVTGGGLRPGGPR